MVYRSYVYGLKYCTLMNVHKEQILIFLKHLKAIIYYSKNQFSSFNISWFENCLPLELFLMSIESDSKKKSISQIFCSLFTNY